MRNVTLLAAGIVIVGLLASWGPAAEISGKISQVSDEAISISIEGSVTPSEGDLVEIFVEVPDVGPAKVGTATVTAVLGKLVLAKIQKASGKVKPGQTARITTGGTSEPKAESDLERLQGSWLNEHSLLDGEPSEAFVGVVGIIDGQNMTWSFTNSFGEKHAQEATFELDPTQTPKHFAVTYRTDPTPDERIYALAGDSLKMGMAAKRGTRPSSFDDAKFQFQLKRQATAYTATSSPGAIQQLQAISTAAGNGDAQAQLRFGKMYLHGDGVERDLSQTVRWFRLAADQGVAEAMSELGFMYRFGLGVRPNEAESARLKQAAAEKGIATDDETAFGWFRKVAEGEYAKAQWMLGNFYAEGKGVAQNDGQAYQWYVAAAKQRHPIGQYQVGKCCVEGKGVRRSPEIGMQWLRVAAKQELPDAQNYIGWMYENGTGVVANRTEAIGWYRKAADQGSRAAKENLRRLGIEP